MAKKSKCYSLSTKAIEKIDFIQKEHDFTSASEALEYILLYQPDENKIKDLVYSVLFKVMSENSISFNTVENKVEPTIDDKMQKILLNAADDIFNNMPD